VALLPTAREKRLLQISKQIDVMLRQEFELFQPYRPTLSTNSSVTMANSFQPQTLGMAFDLGRLPTQSKSGN
jgi:hypothetical protein